MLEPDTDSAGIAIDGHTGMTPHAIPSTGKAKRSNQDKVAHMRRSMEAV